MLQDVAGNLTYPMFRRKVASSPTTGSMFSKSRVWQTTRYTDHNP